VVALRENVSVPTPEVAAFGDQVAAVLACLLGSEVVGVYFVGSDAPDGFIPGESDIDLAAVAESALTTNQRQQVAAAIVELSAACPARGLEFTLYRRDIAGSPPLKADLRSTRTVGRGCPLPCTSTRRRSAASGTSWTEPSLTGPVL
jgi:hypothetical protein